MHPTRRLPFHPAPPMATSSSDTSLFAPDQNWDVLVGHSLHIDFPQMTGRMDQGQGAPRIVLLSAPSGAGKTTICQTVTKLATQRGYRLAGILSLPVLRDGEKVAIRLHDIATGAERILARKGGSGTAADIGCWVFDSDTVAWGQNLLDHLPPSDVLVVDEIGPLELEMGRGLTQALETLRRGAYRLALVSVRPTLLATLPAQLTGLRLLTLSFTVQDRRRIPRRVLRYLNLKETE